MNNKKLPVKNVLYSQPRSQLNNRNLKNALMAHLITIVVDNVHAIRIHCVSDFTSTAGYVKQLAARRRLLKNRLWEFEEVSIYLYFLHLSNDIQIFIFLADRRKIRLCLLLILCYVNPFVQQIVSSYILFYNRHF